MSEPMDERPDFESDAQMPAGLAEFLNVTQGREEAPEPEPETVEPEEDLDDFDSDTAADLIGVINLGAMERKFEVLGHDFVLKTLKVGEELAIAKVVDEWSQTIGQGRAYATGQVAASLVTVDGHAPARGLGPDVDDNIESRFRYILSRWDWEVVAELHAKYQELQTRKLRAYEFLRGKSTASRTTSTS